jgi:hypothetical protein
MSIWLFKILGTEIHSKSFCVTLASTLKRLSAFFWNVTQRRFVVSYRCCGTTYRSQLQAYGSYSLVLEERITRLSETSVINHQSTLRNIPEKRKSHSKPFFHLYFIQPQFVRIFCFTTFKQLHIIIGVECNDDWVQA